MKKQCPHCASIFFGRSDKLFCSLSCKNGYHNAHRKEDIANTVNHFLHQNRSILQQLIPPDSKPTSWDRKVLERLGFKFDIMTGFVTDPNGTIHHKVYEYGWVESKNDNIILERL